MLVGLRDLAHLYEGLRYSLVPNFYNSLNIPKGRVLTIMKLNCMFNLDHFLNATSPLLEP
jgi:hypothetical protein